MFDKGTAGNPVAVVRLVGAASLSCILLARGIREGRASCHGGPKGRARARVGKNVHIGSCRGLARAAQSMESQHYSMRVFLADLNPASPQSASPRIGQPPNRPSVSPSARFRYRLISRPTRSPHVERCQVTWASIQPAASEMAAPPLLKQPQPLPESPASRRRPRITPQSRKFRSRLSQQPPVLHRRGPIVWRRRRGPGTTIGATEKLPGRRDTG